ncbi:hypothetical protein SDRG_05965 [Saprolegnia diclina VS20]|uniref:Uncharacterized protein n=1 Tax=Saprolegnia diclina (strain VS20) TaxID=1156394 RepID=T0QF25_SAPDV|nr:hypothetical protein SDRG_05965 [Saprolegnia diclina VS20]EQC36514.1 hypothetical protein SDRG_05965 [Saprolegnia diclina VS20]|eukprot:XP_008609935.1 hypothetical protein SDRG_05965 [Saprolegnia diclina VS20]
MTKLKTPSPRNRVPRPRLDAASTQAQATTAENAELFRSIAESALIFANLVQQIADETIEVSEREKEEILAIGRLVQAFVQKYARGDSTDLGEWPIADASPSLK